MRIIGVFSTVSTVKCIHTIYTYKYIHIYKHTYIRYAIDIRSELNWCFSYCRTFRNKQPAARVEPKQKSLKITQAKLNKQNKNKKKKMQNRKLQKNDNEKQNEEFFFWSIPSQVRRTLAFRSTKSATKSSECTSSRNYYTIW